MNMKRKRAWPNREERLLQTIKQIKVTREQALEVITNGGPTLKTLNGNYFRIVQCPRIGKLTVHQKDSVIAQIWGIRHQLQHEASH